ncbi:MAG: 2-amino-4-hydroxy-6-hydroxymethyldihydropteridine diphosphokinase [Pirellulales bacterium]|nr:2-amino-4-hydroxy-6-hydroxymethyldihydropteridine diphosphokinase [Pirellulales bacterium]
MIRALVALGSSLGDRSATLDAAVAACEEVPGLRVLACSRWWATRGVGGTAPQSEFLNGALVAETSLTPHELLGRLQVVEQRLGRTRDRRWAPRTLDLDLLLYGDVVIETPRLEVPHPRMSFRRFVLDPACEVAAEMLHPVCRQSLDELRAALDRRPRWAAVIGPTRTECEELAERAAAAIGGRHVAVAEVGSWSDASGVDRWSLCSDWRPGASADLPADERCWPVLCAFVADAPAANAVPLVVDQAGVLRAPGPLLRLAPGEREQAVIELVAALQAAVPES